MIEYRIGERDRRFWIEVKSNKAWVSLNQSGVPRYFDSLADARSWVATIKRGVVYHDAEDAPITVTTMWERYSIKDAQNLPADERKAEDAIKTPHSVWDEMDEDMLSANVPTGEIVGLLNHWRNKYTIARKDAPNLAQDERKAEYDTSDGIKPLEWFLERIGTAIRQEHAMYLRDEADCTDCFYRQGYLAYRYSDPR